MPEFATLNLMTVPELSTDETVQWLVALTASGPRRIKKSAAFSQRKSLTTDANGLVTWTFDTPFAGTPHIGCLPLDSGANPIAWKMTALSPTAVSFRAQRYNVLSLTLATLTAGTVNYFVPASAITLNAIAVPP